MKIQLDYDRKVITLESNTNVKTFFDLIKGAIADWKEWTLDCKTEIVWKTNEVIKYRDFNGYPPNNWRINSLMSGMFDAVTSTTDGAGLTIGSLATQARVSQLSNETLVADGTLQSSTDTVYCEDMELCAERTLSGIHQLELTD